MKAVPIDLTSAPKTTLAIPLFLDPVCAGFPSPARDHLDQSLDFNELIVRHPASTFSVRAEGESMIQAGIGPGDILVADRSLTPRHQNIVIAAVDGEFVVKRLETIPVPRLISMNDLYPDIELTDGQELEIWGVVTHCIKQYI